MKILRALGILALTAGLVLGSSGSVLAKGPPDELPSVGPHSPGKQGLFGTVESIVGYELTLEGSTVVVTLTNTAKYMVTGETKGPVDREAFEAILDGDITAIVGRRIAVLVTFTNETTADALRLMLIPITPPLHAHRIGIVDEFNPGSNITIIDKDGESHTFTINEDTVYRPDEIAGLTGTDLELAIADGFVTVVTKGDPKLGPEAKAIVLHEELPDWAQS